MGKLVMTGMHRHWGRGNKNKYMVALYCPSCGRIFKASRIGRPCPSCTEPFTWPADQLPALSKEA